MQSLEAQVACHVCCIRREAESEDVLIQKSRIPIGVRVALTSREPSAFSESPALNRFPRLVQEHKPVIIESGDRLLALVQQDLSVSAECQPLFVAQYPGTCRLDRSCAVPVRPEFIPVVWESDGRGVLRGALHAEVPHCAPVDHRTAHAAGWELDVEDYWAVQVGFRHQRNADRTPKPWRLVAG